MDKRLQLQSLLETLLGSRNVYFQPPATVSMSYPCIVYAREKIDSTFANNLPYNHEKRYQVTVIDRNPDSSIPDQLAKLPLTSHSRQFVADKLHHNVFNLYF